ncbi:hypothetical protein [Streptomyces hypolithicus]
MPRSENHPRSPAGARAPEEARAGGERRRRFRHEFRPGKLIAGLVLLGTAGAYAADAAGGRQIPAYIGLPVVLCGLLLAGTASWIAYSVRRRRAATAASREKTAAPASTSGSQATR